MKRSVRLLFMAGIAVLALTLGLALAACGEDEDDGDDGNGAAPTATEEVAAPATPTEEAATTPEETGGATTLKVEESEFAISGEGGAALASVPAGDVTFEATNVGQIEHNLYVFKTDLAEDALPVTDGSVPEDGEGVEFIGEIEDVAAGTSASGTFTLAAGSYVLLCNIPGHYDGGMHAALTVE